MTDPKIAVTEDEVHAYVDNELPAERRGDVEAWLAAHPVEVPGSERDHLQQWLTKRCGWDVRAPQLDATGLKLVGGRLLPGPTGPASFLMYESASGERFTLYTSRAKPESAQMRYTAAENSGAMYWSEDGVGYVLSGPTDKDRLNQVARLVYDQTEKTGGGGGNFRPGEDKRN